MMRDASTARCHAVSQMSRALAHLRGRTVHDVRHALEHVPCHSPAHSRTHSLALAPAQDKKNGDLILCTALAETNTDMKFLAARLKAKNPRLAAEEILMEALGLKKGAVTPLSCVADPTNKVQTSRTCICSRSWSRRD
jgi:hypothetical protein